MFEPNIERILESIAPTDLVLDVGGSARPFNRANWVIDIMPYDTRGKFGAQGGEREYFTKDTWLQRDLCLREPFPFPDKMFDFVVCSHTLEDIRDPIFVCSEIVRVGKRGYIEVPSMDAELAFCTETRHYAGYYHHRWLVEIRGCKIDFFFKPHFIHGLWRYHLPRTHRRRMTEDEGVQWLFWSNHFDYEERIFIEGEDFMNFIEGLVRKRDAYPAWYYYVESIRDAAKDIRRKLRS